MTEIIVSIIIPIVFVFMGLNQIKKAEEVGIQKGGKVFISSKSRLVFCGILSLLFIGLGYYLLWTNGWGLCLIAISPAIVLYMIAATCICAYSDSHLHITQTMKIGAVTFTKTENKNGRYTVYLKYNGAELKHIFSQEGYEYMKAVKEINKALRNK